jgi:hypothetical protein
VRRYREKELVSGGVLVYTDMTVRSRRIPKNDPRDETTEGGW